MLLLLASRSVLAQVPYDSLPADTLTRDTVNTTAKYLKALTANRIVLPVMPLVGVDVPLPPASREVLTRDSLSWATAETVGDLLQRIPGVYLWRGGWLGRTEYPDFRGRGPTSVEYLVDGLPYIPIGPDSVGIDPSLFSASLYDRIEIERWPGQLRVHLFTRRQDRQAPYSHVGIAAGDKSIARYIGSLEKRFPSGLGFAFGGERLVAPTATGNSSDFDITNSWLQLGYVPNNHFGVQAELVHSSPDRKPFVSLAGDTLDLALKGSRSDAQLRVFWRRQRDELGLRADAFLGRTTWKGGGVDDQVRQGGVVLGWRSPTIGISTRLMNRSRWTPVDLLASVGWTPATALSASVEAGYQRHDRDRTSRWIAVRGGLGLPLGFVLSGALKQGSLVQAPSVLTDQAQSLTDWQTTLQWNRARVGLELGYGHTDAFRSQAYRPYLASIDSLRPAAGSEWLTVGWRLAPRSWLTLQGWYSDPLGKATPDGVPPTHSLTSATIRSKFWRTFPSGSFDFKATIGVESWGDGIIGRDATGQPIPLDGATFLRTMVEIQLDHFQLYWDRYNLQGSRKSYVPGFNLPFLGATFGVRWQFAN
ncbi:MAG: TonB-dependent receptor [Gemmatimonadales bacterium]